MTESRVATAQPEEDQEASLREEMYALHARFCQGLGDPKRLIVISALRDGEKTVSELAQAAGARQANISQHLALMRHLGLVYSRRVDNNVFYRLADPRIVQAVDLLRAVQAEQHERHVTSLSAGVSLSTGVSANPT